MNDLLEGKPFSYQFKDILDWNSSASNTRFAEMNVGLMDILSFILPSYNCILSNGLLNRPNVADLGPIF